MKGVIAACLGDLVKEKFGKEKWEDALEDAGLRKTTFFMPSTDIDDETVLKLVGSVCKVLNITMTQAADAFGDYWVNVYAPKIYKIYFRNKNNAREFLENMDAVHKTVTERIPDAKPPRFDYDWKDDKTLVMTYKSARGLIDIFIGLVRGVGRYFKEDLKITKMNSTQVKIVFPK